MPKAEIIEVEELAEIPAEDPEAIAQSIFPYSKDDDRARYLGLRASGFKVREALQLVNKHKSTLTSWRTDSQFVELERNLPSYGKKLSVEYVWLAFMRNLVLVGILDYRVLQKAINCPDEMVNEYGKPTFEAQYLSKLRTFYTPQQLQVLEALISGNGDGASKEVDFTNIVLEMNRTSETIKITSKESILPKEGIIEN